MRPYRPARPPTFSPRFTLSLFYVAALVIVFGLLFALPDLLAGARALPPGPDELTPEELARARDIARNALQGRVFYALAAALATFGLLVWRGWLPGVGARK
jgi:hypothetical protein